ncbi:TolC family protein, partial [Deinococcus pimensis]|uniref:TolC family protein n=1 Tax=Deinococcus pimensis TaxID=309888 RepID=UPI00146FC813
IAAQQSLAGAQATLANATRDRALPNVTANVKYGAGGTGLSGSLNLTTGVASAGVTTGFGGGATSLSLGVGASFTLVDPVGDAKVASARTQVASAELALSLARQNVELDVRQKYDALTSARL